MIQHLVAGVLLLASALLIILPAMIALAGPDDEDAGHVSEGWRQRHQ